MWEASPAKFGSLPYLLAANSYLKDNIEVDSTLHEFCNNMFGEARGTVYEMLQLWGSEEASPDKYTTQLYLQLMNTAVRQTQNASAIVKQRLRELKAYLHYMVLYYGLDNNDQDKSITKEQKDATLCMYLAKTNKLQLINSYFMIATIVSKYVNTSDFYVKYNATSGTAYQGGNLPLITDAEIDENFIQDLARYGNRLEDFKMEEASVMKGKFNTAAIAPIAKINTKLMYTNGLNYYNKASFNIIAPAAGSFSIQYTPAFDMPGKGYINFVVESADKALQIVKDFSLDNTSAAGTLKIDLPQAGNYILTVVSKYKSSVELSITTNGNYFYKSGAFLAVKQKATEMIWPVCPVIFISPTVLAKCIVW